MKNLISLVFLLLLSFPGFAAGYDVKTSSIIDQPGVEVLGDYKGSWYVVAFEKPGTLNKPPKYKLIKYTAGFPTAKMSPMYPSFGEKTLYLKAAIINNKISLFYGVCNKLIEKDELLDKREGRREIAAIYRQDFDPITLESAGERVEIFNEQIDRFAASGIEIGESADKSKTAVLIKCYYRSQKYKVILTDNNTGELYSKVFELKPLKEYLQFQKVEVSNDGRVFMQTKVRTDVLTMATPDKDKAPVLYYFFSIDKHGDTPKSHNLTLPIQKGKYAGEPVISILKNGHMLVAYHFCSSDKSNVTRGIAVIKFDEQFNVVGTQEIVPDATLLSQAAEYHSSKKETGLPCFEVQQLLPLENAEFVLLGEYSRTTYSNDTATYQRHYMLAYRFDASLNVSHSQFIPKKQSSTLYAYAFSGQAYAKGNDAYLFHNADWETDEEHGMAFYCTKLATASTPAETKKIVQTHDDFFTSLERMYCRADGKVLFTEEKLVEYADVSREVKLLEVTIK